MGLLSVLKHIFSGNSANTVIKANDAVEYQGYTIVTQPQATDNSYRVNGFIRKDRQEHHFIRSDRVTSLSECHQLTLQKAKVTIDQLGDKLFE